MADKGPYLIKRYSNRKLYDSVRRRFTTLDEIAGLVDAGVRITVRDHDIGTDRTDEVLAQLLRRRAARRPGSGSAGLLADLLRAPTDVAQSVVSEVSGKPKTDSGPTPEPDDTSDSEPSPDDVIEPGPTQPTRSESDYQRQQEEISELRDQVRQLTEAVTLMVQAGNRDPDRDT